MNKYFMSSALVFVLAGVNMTAAAQDAPAPMPIPMPIPAEELSGEEISDDKQLYPEPIPYPNSETMPYPEALPVPAYTGDGAEAGSVSQSPLQVLSTGPDISGSASTSAVLNLNEPIISDIGEAGDTDWFRFNVGTLGEYIFTMKGQGETPLDDTAVKIYSTSGELLKGMEYPQLPFTNDVFDSFPLAVGSYFISAEGSGAGGYTLSVEKAEYSLDSVAGDKSTAARIKPGDKLEHALQGDGDKDWFRFETEGGLFVFDLLKFDQKITIKNPVASLYDSDGELLQKNISVDGKNLEARIVADLVKGTYFIEVDSLFNMGFGSYQLMAAEMERGGDVTLANINTTQSLESGQLKTGKIDYFYDRDWYKLTVNPSDVDPVTKKAYLGIDLEATSDIENARLEAQIYDSQGRPTNMDSASFEGMNTGVIEFSIEEGSYYLSVQTGPVTTADYTVKTYLFNAQDRDPLKTLYGIDEVKDVTGGDGVVSVYFFNEGEPLETNNWAETFISEGWNEYQQGQILSSLKEFEAYLDITFERVDSPTVADLGFVSNSFLGSAGLAITTDEKELLPAEIILLAPGEFNGITLEPGKGMDRGAHGYYTLIHEFAHNLGLAHPVDNGGGSALMLGIAEETDLGDFDLNQGIHTIMSLNDGWARSPAGQRGSQLYGASFTPMALDLAILHKFHKPNLSANAGDTEYVLPSKNELGTGYSLIWDTAGSDTIIHKSDEPATVDLRAATLKYEYGGGGFVSAVNSIFGGFTIANGVMIEHATGGTGADTIIGNEFDNTITGRSGDDTLTGGHGADKFIFNVKTDGHDEITDFEDQDVVVISHSKFSNPMDVLAAIVESDGGAKLRINHVSSIAFSGLNKTHLKASNFELR